MNRLHPLFKLSLFVFLFFGVDTLRAQHIYKVWDFRKFLYGHPIHKTKAGFDSVNVVHRREFQTSGMTPTLTVTYVGQMKDGLPHGTGSYVYDGLPVYSGQWENGVAQGYGVFTSGTSYDYRWKFRGYFKNGLPVNGLVRYGVEAGIYYSGDVKLQPSGWALTPHGYGRFYVSSGLNHWLYVGGSYHEGQFVDGAPTGFGVYNIYQGIPTDLRVGLTLTGVEVANLGDLSLPAEIMEKKGAVRPGTKTAAALKKLLPEIDNAVFDSIRIIKGVTYFGQVYKNDPYGLGIIKYDDGLAEFGFWKNGELIPTINVLKTLLPDSSVLDPVPVEMFYPTIQFTVNKKLKKYERKPIVILVNEKRKVLYYSKVINGQPVGYGWAVDTAANGLVIAANFNGVTSKTQWGSDTTFLQVSGDAAKDLGYNTNVWYDKILRVPLKSINASTYTFPVAMNRAGMKIYYDVMSYGSVKLFPTSAMVDPTPGSNSYKNYLDEQAGKSKKMSELMASRPTATVTKAVVYTRNLSTSYVVTSAGNLSGLWVGSGLVQPGDAVFTGKGFDYANLHGIVPIGAPQYGGKYWVIRSHNLKNNTFENTCSACKGTGGTTSTNSIQVQDGYKTSVNYNTPGYSNGAVVYTPSYKSVGTYQTKNVCSVCKGRPYSTSDRTVVEVY
jgi:hypothetical protein